MTRDREPAPDYGPLRWRSRRVRAWATACACAALVWTLGGDAFSAAQTARILRPVIEFFVRDFSTGDMFTLLTAIRKSMHFAIYGLLALSVIRALWIGSMDSLVSSLPLTLAFVAAMAVADEFRQSYSAVRTGSGWDVLLDLAGAVSVAFALIALQAARRAPLFAPERGRG